MKQLLCYVLFGFEVGWCILNARIEDVTGCIVFQEVILNEFEGSHEFMV